MSLGFLRSVQSRLLKQNTLEAISEQGRWLNSMVHDFRTPVTEGMKPAVLLYGSAVSGTAFDTGDADYAVLFAQTPTGGEGEWRVNPVARDAQEQVLSKLHDHIRQRCKECDTAFKSQRIFRARIPVIKCATTRSAAGDTRQFDISLSADGVKNSVLLRQYMQSDARLRAGALCVKEWGKKEQILNARHGWISPYALTIMYVFYAQQTGLTSAKCDEIHVSVSPLIAGAVSASATAGESLQEPCGVHSIVAWCDIDEATVLNDVRGFFRFFSAGAFDFDSDVVDIRVNNPIRTKNEWFAQLGQVDETELWHLLGHQVFLLRDPFEAHNLGRSVDFFKAESIRERLRIAAEAENPLLFLEC